MTISYTWVKLVLQTGLVKKRSCRDTHRRRLPKPLPGVLLHIHANKHAWLHDEQYYDLITILNDATGQIAPAPYAGRLHADGLEMLDGRMTIHFGLH